MAVYNSAKLMIAGCFFMAACTVVPRQKKPGPQSDPTSEAWYRNATTELTSLSKDAARAYEQGKADRASLLIEQGEALAARVLSVPRPTLAAAEAASDLDDLYGRMLFRNRHYGWARLQFQKNLARWKHWLPKTEESDARLKAANRAIAECDRNIDLP